MDFAGQRWIPEDGDLIKTKKEQGTKETKLTRKNSDSMVVKPTALHFPVYSVTGAPITCVLQLLLLLYM